jgi:hypothetical protein
VLILRFPFHLRFQSVELSRLAIYLDSDAAPWDPPGGWDALPQDDAAAWDALFAPGVASDDGLAVPDAAADATAGAAEPQPADASGADAAPARQYLLSPVRKLHPQKVHRKKANGNSALTRTTRCARRRAGA